MQFDSMMKSFPLYDGLEIRPIDGFPGYVVTNFGEIYSCRGGVFGHHSGQWQRLKLSKINGYNYARLRRDGKTHFVPVSRTVLIAFEGPKPAGWVARHENNDSFDDRYENLSWQPRRLAKQASETLTATAG